MQIKNLKRPYYFQIKQQKNIIPYNQTMMIFLINEIDNKESIGIVCPWDPYLCVVVSC